MAKFVLLETTATTPNFGETSREVFADSDVAAVSEVVGIPADQLRSRPWGPAATIVGLRTPNPATPVCVFVVAHN